MNWENECPKLSFTVENKITNNLHRIGCSHFKLNIINGIFHYCKIFGIRKCPEYLYRLFDVLPKQATYEMKALQVQVYIKQ